MVIALLSTTLMAFSLIGCKDDADIKVYNVPKMADVNAPAAPKDGGKHAHPHPHPHTPAATAVRMVGAIIPREDRVWFFKALAPEPLIQPKIDLIRKFISEVRFVANSVGAPNQPKESPQWTLPQGWKAQGSTGMRFDTIQIGGDAHPIELSVTPLGPGSGDVKANIERWAGQVGVGRVSPEQLAEFGQPMTVSGKPATFVNIPGPGSGDASMANRPTQPQKRPPNRPMTVAYETPEGWTELKASGMRMAAFSVTDGKSTAEVTVIPLPMDAAEAASPMANINRWRGQVSLKPLTQDDILKDLEASDRGEKPKYIEIIDVDKQQALLTDMTAPESASPRERILGVLHPLPQVGYIYFYKMKGPADLVGANKDKFRALLKSVAYEP